MTLAPDVARTIAATHARLGATRARLRERDADIVRLQVELSEIPAPTGGEGVRAERVAELFRRGGLSGVAIDAAGNATAYREGAEPGEAPVVVCAHLDTVFPRETPLTVRAAGPRLVGPGIGDNGRGLAVMLALASAVDGATLRTRRSVVFAATTGEEGAGDLSGAKALFRGAAADAHAAIALDGAGDERVVHGALGSRRFRVAFAGPGGHSWSAYGVPNPVHAAASAAARLAALHLPEAPRVALSVTRIGGGLSVNAIPEEAWIEVDLRSTCAASLDRHAAEIGAAVHAATDEENGRRARGTPALSARVLCIGDRPCGEIPVEHALVQAAFEATRLVGRVPASAIASTDANVPIGLGIPAVAIGAGGRGGDAHTVGEWYDNTDGSVGVARALTLLVSAAELAA